MGEIKVKTSSEKETMALGMKFSKLLPDGSVICLTGDLGAGKTTFTRGVAKGLNINEVVQSPTFNIMKIYLKGDRPLIHIDAYRLLDVNSDIGLDEYIGYETGLTLIEWPMYIEKLIPSNHVELNFRHLGDDEREIIIKANKEIIEGLKND